MRHSLAWFPVIELQAVGHERQQGLEAVEIQITGQCPDVLEKHPARGQRGAHRPIRPVIEFEDGVEQKSEQVEADQGRGEMVVAVTEVVFQVIALGFQRVVVFILDFPAGAAGGDEFDNSVGGNRRVGDPGVAIAFMAVGIGGDKLAPVDRQRGLAIAQRQVVGEFVGVDFTATPFAAGDLDLFDMASLAQSVQPFIQQLVGAGLAHEDKIEARGQGGFAQRLVGVQIVAKQRDSIVAIRLTAPGQPTLGRGMFRVLLVMAILGGVTNSGANAITCFRPGATMTGVTSVCA